MVDITHLPHPVIMMAAAGGKRIATRMRMISDPLTIVEGVLGVCNWGGRRVWCYMLLVDREILEYSRRYC